MWLKTIDLTIKSERATFTGSSQKDVEHAEVFWRSVDLHPPMESRLVSSDIRQRLKKPTSRSYSNQKQNTEISKVPDFKDLFTRANAMDEIRKIRRLCQLSLKRDEDRERLRNFRNQRMEVESLSGRARRPTGQQYPASDNYNSSDGHNRNADAELDADVQDEIRRFELLHGMDDD